MQQIPKGYARGRTPKGVMNRLEKKYALEVLDPAMERGFVAGYWYEKVRFELAKLTYYTPDFKVYFRDGTVEYHEVKGRWLDKARVKIKIAASMWPIYRWIGVMWKGKQWVYEVFEPEEMPRIAYE